MRNPDLRRVRLDLDLDEVRRIGELRAHYSRINGRVITAHAVMAMALDNLHQKMFEEEKHPTPENWMDFDQ